MYEVFAIKIGERETDCSNVLFHTDQGRKFLIVYCFWLLKSSNQTILVDTGISQDELSSRGISGPTQEEILSRINIRPDTINTIILSHLHGDHFAKPEIYSNAIFYIQRKEVEYWSEEVQGFPLLSRPGFLHGKPSVDMEAFQKINMAGRVRFLDGDCEIYPGLSTILLGGHTPGHQLVRVETCRGPVLLCVDFAEAYRNLEERIPIGNYTNLVEWMTGLSRIERMRLPKQSLIPGHDNLVMTNFPRVAEGIVKIA